MSRIARRRVVPVAIALVALLMFSGVAYAYWSAGGSGTGTAQAAAGTSNLTVKQTTVLTGMYPGDSAQTISGNFDNPNPGPVYVTTVTASIGSVTKAGGAPAGTCDATDFTLGSATATVNAEIPAGLAKGAWTGPTIKFNDKGAANQDACKGATVNLTYSIP
jgi:hypothetical protein